MSNEIFDPLLNLEEQYYDEGYEEGKRDGKHAGFLEGKQFGLQTGYQRFLSIGVLQGRLDIWKDNLKENEKVQRHLNQFETVIDNVPMSNSEADVEEFEKRLKKAKAKTKVICSVGKDNIPVKVYDDQIDLKHTEEVIEDVGN
jgi:fructose-1-phosphate kinase PfkB-like protein